MNFKKAVGSFFRPRNAFSRAARVGGAALGGAFGGPQGAQMGYGLGDKLAGTWEKDDSEKGGFENAVMRGKLPGGGSSMGLGNLFSRGGGENPSLSGDVESGGGDIMQILNLLKMSGKI